MDFANNSTEKIVNYTLKFKKEDLSELRKKDDIENILKLSDSKYTNYSNMHLYNNKGIICKYDTVEDIMRDYYQVRLQLYISRKKHQLDIINHQLELISSKVKFISMVVNEQLKMNNVPRLKIEEELTKHKFKQMGISKRIIRYSQNFTRIANCAKIRSCNSRGHEPSPGLARCFYNKRKSYKSLRLNH